MAIILYGIIFAAAAALTGAVRAQALRQQILDIPNARSSHTRPTPRGGGIAFTIAFCAGVILLWATGGIDAPLAVALLVGIGVAIIGYLDDIGGVPALVRLVLHLTAGGIGVILLGGLPTLDLGIVRLEWGIVGTIVAAVGLAWMINMYNFMDGIDGLAGSQAVFLGVAGLIVVPSIVAGATGGVLAAACLGFLVWNWQPAKIFMGDVGSGFLGYVVGILMIAGARETPAHLWVWLILLAVFVVDPLLTLINRVRRGETWHEAHRTHAYQHAAIRAGGHARVTLTVIAIDLVWLLPLALLAAAYPQAAVGIALIAYTPVIALASLLHAGRVWEVAR